MAMPVLVALPAAPLVSVPGFSANIGVPSKPVKMNEAETLAFHNLFEAEEVDVLELQTFMDDDGELDRLFADNDPNQDGTIDIQLEDLMRTDPTPQPLGSPSSGSQGAVDPTVVFTGTGKLCPDTETAKPKPPRKPAHRRKPSQSSTGASESTTSLPIIKKRPTAKASLKNVSLEALTTHASAPAKGAAKVEDEPVKKAGSAKNAPKVDDETAKKERIRQKARESRQKRKEELHRLEEQVHEIQLRNQWLKDNLAAEEGKHAALSLLVQSLRQRVRNVATSSQDSKK